MSARSNLTTGETKQPNRHLVLKQPCLWMESFLSLKELLVLHTSLPIYADNLSPWFLHISLNNLFSIKQVYSFLLTHLAHLSTHLQSGFSSRNKVPLSINLLKNRIVFTFIQHEIPQTNCYHCLLLSKFSDKHLANVQTRALRSPCIETGSLRLEHTRAKLCYRIMQFTFIHTAGLCTIMHFH